MANNKSPNYSLKPTAKSYVFGFPPLRSGAA